jgi:hypothetical protein
MWLKLFELHEIQHLIRPSFHSVIHPTFSPCIHPFYPPPFCPFIHPSIHPSTRLPVPPFPPASVRFPTVGYLFCLPLCCFSVTFRTFLWVVKLSPASASSFSFLTTSALNWRHYNSEVIVVALRLAVCRQSVRRTTNPYYIALAGTAHKTSFPYLHVVSVAGKHRVDSCFLTTAVVLSPVYSAVSCQWVNMSQYFNITYCVPGNIDKIWTFFTSIFELLRLQTKFPL